MADPMRIRATLKDGVVDVKVLMSHPMETGQRKDTDGSLVPVRYIKRVVATCNGKEVLTADWGPSVSKNPFLQFSVKGAKAGDKIQVTWKDNKGDSRTDEATVS